LNNFADFCSVARIPGFTVTNAQDADYIFKNHLAKPGFRIVGVSQRLGKTEIIEPEKPLKVFGNGGIFQYSGGEDATLVSFNFSFPQVHKLNLALREKGIETAHFNVNSALAADWSPVVESVKKTKKIVVVDDSKSAHVPADALLAELAGMPIEKKLVLKRHLGDDWLYPVSDVFEIDEERVIKELS
jgi:pyruvate/2-oxoglutarate/acetoin dehydrogenase E1 component